MTTIIIVITPSTTAPTAASTSTSLSPTNANPKGVALHTLLLYFIHFNSTSSSPSTPPINTSTPPSASAAARTDQLFSDYCNPCSPARLLGIPAPPASGIDYVFLASYAIFTFITIAASKTKSTTPFYISTSTSSTCPAWQRGRIVHVVSVHLLPIGHSAWTVPMDRTVSCIFLY